MTENHATIPIKEEMAMRGRIIVVAYEKALYQVRITAPQNWYSYYEHVFRNVCNTLKFN